MPTNTNERTVDLAKADALLQKALPQIELDIFDDPTVEALQKTKKLYEKWEEKEKIAEVYEYWGYYHNYLEDREEALFHFQRSLDIRLTIFGERHEAVAAAYRGLGAYYIEVLEPEKAKKYIDKALDISLNVFGEKHSLTIQIYCLLGLYYDGILELQEAIRYFKKTLSLAEQVPDCPTILWAKVYGSLGIIYLQMEDHVRAKDCLHKSLAFFLKILPSNHKSFNSIYYHLAFILKREGDYQKAQLYLQQAANSIQNHNSDSVYNAYILHEMANICMSLVKYEKTIDYDKRVISILQKNGNKKNLFTFGAYLNIGAAYGKLNKIPQAFQALEQCKEVALTFLPKNHFCFGKIYRAIAVLYRFLKDFDCAIKHFQLALSIFRNDKDTGYLDFLETWRDMSWLYLDHGKYIPALEYCQKVLTGLLGCPDEKNYYEDIAFLKKSGNYSSPIIKIFFTGILCLKGNIFYQYYKHKTQKIKELKAAFNSYDLIFSYMDVLRKSFYSDESKIYHIIGDEIDITLSIACELYNRTSEVAHLYAAFRFTEKNKAYVLLGKNQEKLAKQKAILPVEMLQQENELREKLMGLEKKIQSEKQKKTQTNLSLLSQYEEENFQAFHQFEALQKQLEATYPEYYHLKYSTFTVSVVELQALLEEGQSVLNYVVGGDEIYLLLVTPDEYEVFAQQKPKNWKKMVQEYLQSIKFSQKEQFVQHSFALYQLLLQEAMSYIIPLFEETSPQIFILPDAELHYLPFETLLVQEANLQTTYEEMDYFLHHCQVSYHYSATLLYFDLEKQIKTQQTPTDITFTGFAPVYETTSNGEKQALAELQAEYTAVNRSEALRSDGTWMPLPHSKTEVENIAQLFVEHGHRSQSFLFESANKQNLIEQFSKNRFILIAAHGIVNQEYPQLSGLVLANEASDIIASTDDSTIAEETERMGGTAIVDCLLNMKEVAMTSTNADLVVLSSCESGIGELHKGEGMMAVNRGFMESGAKNVISTLFKVNDRASSELTQLLFQHILEGNSFAIALQKAKLVLLKRKGMSPKMWSGFVLFGAGDSKNN